MEKGVAAGSSIPAWEIPGTESLVGCRVWGHGESGVTEQLNGNTRGLLFPCTNEAEAGGVPSLPEVPELGLRFEPGTAGPV